MKMRTALEYRRRSLLEMPESTRHGHAVMSRPRLKTALVRRGHTRPSWTVRVQPRTFEFDFEDVPVIINAFRRMVRGLEFDICEMAMTTYLCARAHGKPFTAIPVFPMRAFHHGAIALQHQGRRPHTEGSGRPEGGRQPRLHGHDRVVGAQHPAARVRCRSEPGDVGALRRRARRRVSAAGQRGPHRAWADAGGPAAGR